jgi:methionine-rich copper-binding protein CopC
MRGPLLIVLLCALAVVPASAIAHAFLDRADPRAGVTIKMAPQHVRLWFTGALEGAYSRVQVLDDAGRRVDLGDSTLEAESRNVMRVSLPTLPPGRYKVRWRVLAVDSHITEGAFTFRVAP